MHNLTDRELRNMGVRWAHEDMLRGHDGPSARWGNTVLDQAYEREWSRITGTPCRR